MKAAISIAIAIHVVILVYFIFFYQGTAKRSEWQPSIRSNPYSAKLIAESKRSTSSCYQTYQKFFKKDPIDIRIVFGYKDARPARFVGDRYEKIALVHYLLGRCPKNFHACGFERSEDDADLLIKNIKGPDGKSKTIHLRITHSSVGPDDDENRMDKFQNWQSRYSKQNFLKGLAEAHAVFYNGHSRDGGGPDFNPPLLTADQSVDYTWYARYKPGMKEMLKALKLNEAHPKLFGLFSCVSTRHFSSEILQAQKKIGLITSEALLYYTDALKNLMGSLSALLGQWCNEDFKYALQMESTRKGSHIKGFFD